MQHSHDYGGPVPNLLHISRFTQQQIISFKFPQAFLLSKTIFFALILKITVIYSTSHGISAKVRGQLEGIKLG